MDETQKKPDFLDYLSVLLKWRRFIIINVLVVTLIAVMTSLLLPKWYRATASVLPPKEPDMLGSLGLQVPSCEACRVAEPYVGWDKMKGHTTILQF